VIGHALLERIPGFSFVVYGLLIRGVCIKFHRFLGALKDENRRRAELVRWWVRIGRRLGGSKFFELKIEFKVFESR
jgi:hypothetical protein